MISSEQRVAIVIPARYGSTRLPGKPLAEIAGKPMIQHVYERAIQISNVNVVIIATDDERIAVAAQAFGANCVMTSCDHPSGTDRLVEVMTQVDADIYINLQGDEPLVRPSDIETLVAGMLGDPSIKVGTLCHPIDIEEAVNPNVVKTVLDCKGNALYFSRSPIPHPRDGQSGTYLKHIGVYAYRRDVLAEYSDLPQPMIEQTEKLEQLRLLAAGYCIRAYLVEPTGPGVDTAECLDKVRALMGDKVPPSAPSLANIRLVITDVDGVLTDGGIYYDGNGECLKRFHVRDGMGIRLLQENGIQVAALSGRDSPGLRKRLADLGVSLFLLGVKDKYTACKNLIESAGVTALQTACIGDDCIDLPAFSACGISFAVADAPIYVQSAATKVLKTNGGSGAFRELSDLLLVTQGKEKVLYSAAGYQTVMDKMSQ
ncbi:3-deoxy-manno-octulosonate cytidylyltransferase [Pseudomonas sp. zbq_5]|uniref:3-deoxy-manno-octulosonate cytidylyltransferase n=1 Tax=unclassified Pseudomonas TaxID=196821 RepID=UPI00370A83FB